MSYSQAGVSASYVTLAGNIPLLDKQREALASASHPVARFSPVPTGWTPRSAAALAVPHPAHPATCSPLGHGSANSCCPSFLSPPPVIQNAVVGEERNCQSSIYLQDSVHQDNTSAKLYLEKRLYLYSTLEKYVLLFQLR